MRLPFFYLISTAALAIIDVWVHLDFPRELLLDNYVLLTLNFMGFPVKTFSSVPPCLLRSVMVGRLWNGRRF